MPKIRENILMKSLSKNSTTFHIELFILIVLLYLDGFILTAGPYCPKNCTCSYIQGFVKCVGDPSYSKQIPSGIKFTITRLSVENYSIPVFNNQKISNLKNTSFFGLTNLNSLDLSSNKITEIDDIVFLSLYKLKYISLSDNLIHTIGNSLSKLPKVFHINLSKNQLSLVSNDTFAGCKELRYLFLDTNNISKIESFAFVKLTKLIRLKLGSNKLGSSDLEFGNHINDTLQYLDISENGLQIFPSFFPSGLKEIRVAYNNITSLGYKNFENYFHLESLWLNNNNISAIEDDTLSGLLNLTKLWLNDNNIMQIPKHLPESLVYLYLHNNRIGPFLNDSEFKGLNALTRLSLQNNNIHYLSTTIFEGCCTDLKALTLQQNYISLLYKRQFHSLTNLTMLSLSKNPLQISEDKCFEGLKSLKILKMSNSGNSWIQPSDLHTYLTRAMLARKEGYGKKDGKPSVYHTGESSSNDNYDDYKEIMDLVKMGTYYKIDLNLFRDVTGNLEVLTLSNSSRLANYLLFHINGPDPYLIFSNLNELELDNNNLTHLPSQFPSMFPKLIELNIDKNNWHCNLNILPLISILNDPIIKVSSKEKIICSSPDVMIGKLIANLTLAELEEFPLLNNLDNQTGTDDVNDNVLRFHFPNMTFSTTISTSNSTVNDDDYDEEDTNTTTLDEMTDISKISTIQTSPMADFVTLTKPFTNFDISNNHMNPNLTNSQFIRITTAIKPKQIKLTVPTLKGAVKIKKSPSLWLTISGILTISAAIFILSLICFKCKPLLKCTRSYKPSQKSFAYSNFSDEENNHNHTSTLLGHSFETRNKDKSIEKESAVTYHFKRGSSNIKILQTSFSDYLQAKKENKTISQPLGSIVNILDQGHSLAGEPIDPVKMFGENGSRKY
ncbi:protein slit-like isoform X2 [Gordionus sp. m RMFG-2023]|uniref:protein slit-like isoform X2 n=1 Tax=Gordionus sp. m RMFG-2023 TaxID=3053472 RepID=UPI0031FCF7E2